MVSAVVRVASDAGEAQSWNVKLIGAVCSLNSSTISCEVQVQFGS